jgi:hypothetical protein
LVSLEHGVDGWEKVTSQRKLALERAGVTSLRDISIVGMHVSVALATEQYGRYGFNVRGEATHE